MLKRRSLALLMNIFMLAAASAVISCSFLFSGEEYSIVLKPDFKQYLINESRYRDSAFNNLINGLNDTGNILTKDFMDGFLKASEENRIDLNKYYGYGRIDNSSIVNMLIDTFDAKCILCIDVLRKRAENYGLKGVRVSREESNKIQVYFEGKIKNENAEKLLTTNGKMEFSFLLDNKTAIDIMSKIDSVLAGKNHEKIKFNFDDDTVYTPNETDPLDENRSEMTVDEFRTKHPWLHLVRPEIAGESINWYINDSSAGIVKKILEEDGIRSLYSPYCKIAFGSVSYKVDETKIHELYLVNVEPSLSGEFIADAKGEIDEETDLPYLYIVMDYYGSYKLKEITRANINNRLAIVSDNVVLMAPVIRSEITGGKCQVEGIESVDIAKVLAAVFKSGILSLPLHVSKNSNPVPVKQ